MSPTPAFPCIIFRSTDYGSARDGLATISGEVGTVHTSLLTTLAGYGGMAGTDKAGSDWGKKYDEAVSAALDASSKLTTTCGRIGNLIAAGAHNHEVADANAKGVQPPAAPAPIAEPCHTSIVPTSVGGTSDEPFGWWLIKEVAGLVWPNGHQDQLRAAKGVWYAAADSLDTATAGFPTAVGLLNNQQSDEIPATVAKCSTTSNDSVEIQAAYRQIGDACDEYAQHLDQAHSEIRTEVRDMLIECAAWEVGFAILIPFTGTLSEWVGNSALVARIAVYGTRIAKIIERLGLKAIEIASRIGTTVVTKISSLGTKLAEWLRNAATRFARSEPGKPGGLGPKPPAVKPTVSDTKLQNILNDLYKGANNANRTGDGTTADAVRNEYLTLEPTEGKWHLTKAMESQRGLAKWLMDKSNANSPDRAVAIREMQNLMDALAGK
ncbi:hypothetical protein [Nocardia ignorata]|uniref:Outer membrane channel protein CpnT-like N-terminal domain-containing protein n=1 Tax=Nocardia ignorata TaxID=145285 RepID=A0A4R6PWR2_NOCIG|nr:hypothetical protein [Nocardia ignorata]TDP42817.1 hypothetical protein DFR75_1011935 [Nocardia ignorata]